MACIIAAYAKFEVHAVTRLLQAEGVDQNKIHCSLQGAYEPKVLSRDEVNVWCQKFKYGQMDLKEPLG